MPLTRNYRRFNPIATSFLTKAVKRISERAFLSSRVSEHTSRVEQVVANCGGDIRAAVNMLQFQSFDDSSAAVSGKDRSLVRFVCLKSCCTKRAYGCASGFRGRDVSIKLFHALGKFLYNKREDASVAVTEQILPRHLVQHRRPMGFGACPEEIVASAGADAETFNLFLFQNVLGFCSDADETEVVARYLSDSDLFFGVWTVSTSYIVYI